MESTGNCQWFVEMATTAGHEVWIGDAAKIRASEVRQQKHDRRDAALILKLLLEGRFPRIWTPSGEEKDLRQLLIHRYKLVRLRAQAKNGLQHLAMNQGVTKKSRLWSKAGEKVLRELPLKPWASRRREDLFKVRAMLDEQIASLDRGGGGSGGEERKSAAANDPAGRGADHFAGVRADDGRCLAISARQAGGELSGADSARVQFGRDISGWGRSASRGTGFMSMLMVEAAQVAVRCDPGFRQEYLHRCHTKAKGVAKVAAARKLAIRLYWMLRTQHRVSGGRSCREQLAGGLGRRKPA